MPRKQVYGKRAQPAPLFRTWSSPEKTKTTLKTTIAEVQNMEVVNVTTNPKVENTDTSGELFGVDDVERQLRDLKIETKESTQPKPTTKEKTKHKEEQQPTQQTKTGTKARADTRKALKTKDANTGRRNAMDGRREASTKSAPAATGKDVMLDVINVRPMKALPIRPVSPITSKSQFQSSEPKHAPPEERRRSPRQTKQQLTPLERGRSPIRKEQQTAPIERSSSSSLSSIPSLSHAPHDSNPYTAHVQSLLNLSNNPEVRKAPIPFSSWAEQLDPYFTITKIAEASYGEVYRLAFKDPANNNGFSKNDESVLKIIALKSPHEEILAEHAQLNRARPQRQKKAPTKAAISKRQQQKEEDEEWMSGIETVESEVKLLQRLAPIPGFTNFRELLVLQGRPAGPFISAWKAWNDEQAEEHQDWFPDPSKKSSYKDTQLWAVIEMQDAGSDIEKLIKGSGETPPAIKSIWEVWDVFWGIVLSVAKSEEAVRFEHRDLHLGNICIRSKNPHAELTKPRIRSTKGKLGFSGLETTIIDYGLSRVDMTDSRHPSASPSPSPSAASSSPSLASSSEGAGQPQIAFTDLSTDPEVFKGDARQEYQYEIYRYMRSIIFHGDPLKTYGPSKSVDVNATWEAYHPESNLVWLHFILHQLLQNIVWPSVNLDLGIIEEEGRVDEQRVRKKAGRLERALREMGELLEPKRLGEREFGCGTDVVAFALLRGWLDQRDVVGNIQGL